MVLLVCLYFIFPSCIAKLWSLCNGWEKTHWIWSWRRIYTLSRKYYVLEKLNWQCDETDEQEKFPENKDFLTWAASFATEAKKKGRKENYAEFVVAFLNVMNAAFCFLCLSELVVHGFFPLFSLANFISFQFFIVHTVCNEQKLCYRFFNPLIVYINVKMVFFSLFCFELCFIIIIFVFMFVVADKKSAWNPAIVPCTVLNVQHLLDINGMLRCATNKIEN